MILIAQALLAQTVSCTAALKRARELASALCLKHLQTVSLTEQSHIHVFVFSLDIFGGSNVMYYYYLMEFGWFDASCLTLRISRNRVTDWRCQTASSYRRAKWRPTHCLWEELTWRWDTVYCCFCMVLSGRELSAVFSWVQVEESEIRDFFAQYGAVKEVKIITYRGGICKG